MYSSNQFVWDEDSPSNLSILPPPQVNRTPFAPISTNVNGVKPKVKSDDGIESKKFIKNPYCKDVKAGVDEDDECNHSLDLALKAVDEVELVGIDDDFLLDVTGIESGEYIPIHAIIIQKYIELTCKYNPPKRCRLES